MVDRWGLTVHPKPGALRRELHIPEGEKIPVGEERAILATPIGSQYNGITVTARLKERVDFALNINGRGRKR